MTTPAVPVPAGAPSSDVGEFLAAAFEALTDPAVIAVMSIPAPLVPVEALVDAAPGEDAVVWDPPEGPAFSAIGAVVTLRGEGAARIAQVRQQAESLSAAIRVIAQTADAPPPPRFFGGFSFQPGAAASDPWTTFGDARFALPRFRYARLGDRAWLSVAVRGAEVATTAMRQTLVARTEALLSALRNTTKRSTPRPGRAPLVSGREETSEGEWTQLVQTIVDRIGQGEFEKIVIARRSTLSFDAAIDVLDVLGELSTTSKHCTRFAFRFGGGTFLGATPERLVRLRGVDLETEAVAGTTRVGDASRATEMMESPKEREEHELVVREIVSSLSSVCASLKYPTSPEVRVLRHLLHLTTPIRGRLATHVHVLDVVERLHPTPAVGGVPGRDAVRFITSHEPVERGWYASPIGWFDAEGDGEFAVALRSGAFVGARAYLYAGGGIVRDSNPVSEYAETRLKLETLCAALHVAQ